MANEQIFFASGNNPKMIKAFEDAQKTFKYFWRELSWEYRRIVPELDMAIVKVAFSQKINENEKPLIEHMWINDIDFNGDNVRGVLANTPNELTNIKNGDEIEVPLSQISDWLFVSQGKTYGGFTIQALRSEMDKEERDAHDVVWGLDFGDYNDILIVYDQKENPENLIEHPMSRNMKDKLIDYVKENPVELMELDDSGYSFFHREAIAGNRTSIEVLLEYGASKNQKTAEGKTALDYAKALNWEHIIPVLE